MLLTSFSELWQNNYLWIIIVLVVLVLALIGYLAEKNNVVSFKKKEDKKVEPVVDNKPVAEIKEVEKTVYEPVINVDGKQVELSKIERISFDDEPQPKDLGAATPTFDSIEIPQPVKEVVPTFEDLNVPYPDDQPTKKEEETQAPMFEDMNSIPPTIGGEAVDPKVPQELYEPFGDTNNEAVDNGESDNKDVAQPASDVWKF